MLVMFLSLLPCITGDGIASAQPTSAPARIVDFQPGVQIDWTERQVVVDATVILRQGPLELFACTPKIREHEAIIRIEARAQHVYQGMGLIGLEPGSPMRYDPATETIHAATGEPVELLVRYRKSGREVTHPVEQWLRPAGKDVELPPLPWVFAGSALTPDDRFAADIEGTVVSVVDFPSALIALAESHTDANESLWLEPVTERIPPVNTSCELIIQSAPLRLTLTTTGRIRYAGKVLTGEALTDLARSTVKATPGRRVVLILEPGHPKSEAKRIMDTLQEIGVKLEVTQQAPSSQPASAPAIDR